MGSLLEAGFQADHQWRGVHHLAGRLAAVQVAAEAHHEDVLQGVAADQAERTASGVDHRQGQEVLALGGEQAVGDIGDAGVRLQRRHGLEQVRQGASGGHRRVPMSYRER
ncbi:hypothetical protein D3C72_2094360 [compost metagenome]